MKIDRRTVGAVEVCAPGDALVDESAEAFGKVLRECIEGPNPRVVVDMSAVSYMDSVALERLLDAADALAERSVPLKLAGVGTTCREILELTRLGSRFQFFEDVEGAVRSFL